MRNLNYTLPDIVIYLCINVTFNVDETLNDYKSYSGGFTGALQILYIYHLQLVIIGTHVYHAQLAHWIVGTP